MTIKHTKTSAIPDGPDAAQVQPSDWNADHSLPVSASRLLGNATGVSAEVAEVSLGSGLVFGAGSLELQLKTVNSESLLGTGNIVIGGGLTLFEESRNTTSPNATVPVHALTAIGAESNIDFVIRPKGNGAITAHQPDGTTAGGDKRGLQSVDLQLSRANSTQVASGQYAAAIGRSCTASGFVACALGYGSVASGNYATAIGTYNTSSGFQSVAIGPNCVASGDYSIAIGAGGLASGQYNVVLGRLGSSRGIAGVIVEGNTPTLGRSQASRFLLYTDTTSNSPTSATTIGNDSSLPTSTAVLPNNSAYYCRVRVLARKLTTDEAKSWSGTALIKRGVNAAATTLVGSSLTSDFGDAGMSTCTVTLSADTTRGALAVTVTGLVGTTVRWVAQLETVEAT